MKQQECCFKGVKRKKRPVGPGASVGHINTRGGTLGAVVKERKSGGILILSNNHVLANCSDGWDGRARKGDAIFQPSIRDGGNYGDIIGRLYKWVPIVQGQPNLVDAAVAEPITHRYIHPEIKGIGRIKGITCGKSGMKIKKLGRTTGLTSGEIIEEDYVVTISFEGKEYTFYDQLVAKIPCREGDSGSVVLDYDNRAVGLLFAAEGELGIINRIEHVVRLLDIEFA